MLKNPSQVLYIKQDTKQQSVALSTDNFHIFFESVFNFCFVLFCFYECSSNLVVVCYLSVSGLSGDRGFDLKSSFPNVELLK